MKTQTLTKTKTKGFSPLGKTGKEATAKKINNKQLTMNNNCGVSATDNLKLETFDQCVKPIN